ncbi:MAG: hypothetical protein R3E77_10010 [Steroidobacteraceae bacterium]
MTSTGEFELGLLTSVATAPAARQDTDDTAATVDILSSLEETRIAVCKVAETAQRLMSIYTRNLEPELYEQSPFLEIIKRFVLARRFAKVRVLITDSPQSIRDRHRFMAMSRRLTSYIDIRPIEPPGVGDHATYIIADDRAIAYRPRAKSWDGVASLNAPAVARHHLTEFDTLWATTVAEDTRYAMRV